MDQHVGSLEIPEIVSGQVIVRRESEQGYRSTRWSRLACEYELSQGPKITRISLDQVKKTQEIKLVVPVARRLGAPVIAITGQPASSLGRLADCVLDIGRVDEACPLGLAPTASTSAMLALGDALAMVALAERGFSRDDYALNHPAGRWVAS